MSIGLLLAFLGVAALAYLTPGPDWFVVMRHAATSRRHGAAAAAGALTGLVVHIGAAALGVAGVLLASAHAFLVLKVLGAAYLVVLGVRALMSARRSRDAPAPAEATGLSGAYRSALLTNLLNPKAALFFLAVLLQFIDPERATAPQVLLLGGLDVALGIVWWVLFVSGVSLVTRALGTARARVALDRVAGVSLIGLGIGLALTPQPRRP